MKYLKFVLLLSALTLTSTVRALPSIQEIKNTEWIVVTTDKGCIVYVTGVFPQIPKSITWSAACQKGLPISGRGTLTYHFHDSEDSKTSFTGQFIGGFMNGTLKMQGTDMADHVFTVKMGCLSSQEPACSSTRPSKVPNGPAAPVAQAPAQTRSTPDSGAEMARDKSNACTEEIKRAQIDSQSWTGNPDDVAARLGRFQKDLFEGRCSGHPEARAYIHGAMKMLAYGGNPAGSGGGAQPAVVASSAVNEGGSSKPSAPLRPDTKSKDHNPAHNATDCIQIYHEAEMKARGMKSILRSMMVNSCAYPISVQWCVVGDQRGPGDCNPGYTNLADLPAKGGRGIDSDNQAVRYAACRFGKDMGFQAVEKDPRFPFRFSCS
jgi:hypothetical protein